MASIVPHGKRFRAHVCVKGVRDSELFETKSEAKAWAANREAELRNVGPTANLTVRELAQRWVERYSHRPSIDWEVGKKAFCFPAKRR